ncbi:MAG: glycosyltransferase [Paramuribaculum sp.]|nr:glycosyltransferase [Paramuribaculum sp.]
MTTLDIAIATHTPAGVRKVEQMILPPQPYVRYVVSWQNHGDAPVPEKLNRPDVKLVRFSGTGLSANRNNALAHCTADIILIADDDIIYPPDAFKIIITVFDSDPTLDLATFKAAMPGKVNYPEKPVDLGRRLPKGYSVTTMEIACRRKALSGLRFCTNLGLGTRYAAGEDEFFLHSAIRSGVHCRFFPIEICRHPDISTGQRANPSAATLRGFGCTIVLLYPLTAVARLPLKAWRLSKSGRCGFFKALTAMITGAIGTPGVFIKYRKQQKLQYD